MIGPATSCGNIDTKQAKSMKFRIARRLAAVHVDGVAHRLERVEADAERQRHPQRGVEPKLRESDPVDEGVVVVDAEVEVLEEAEQRQVGDHRDRQDQLGAPGARSIRVDDVLAADQHAFRLAMSSPDV